MNDMSNTEVITAFVDGEEFEPGALTDALATGEGRELLIDLMALRHLVTDDAVYDLRVAARPSRSRWAAVAAAAAIVVAVGGGYLAGRAAADAGSAPGIASAPVSTTDAAPEPTRVIELRPGVEWKSAGEGR